MQIVINGVRTDLPPKGDPGKNYLGYDGSLTLQQEPAVDDALTFLPERFTRTPTVGDNFIVLGLFTDDNLQTTTYILNCVVTDPDTVLASIDFVQPINGKQGPAALTYKYVLDFTTKPELGEIDADFPIADFNHSPEVGEYLMMIAKWTEVKTDSSQEHSYILTCAVSAVSDTNVAITILDMVETTGVGGEVVTTQYTAGDDITIEKNIISVTTPTKAIFTPQFETDVPSDQRESAFFLVTNPDTSVTTLVYKNRVLDLGIRDYVAGNGISLDGRTINVQCPIFTITQAEYDALTEEQRNSETLWIVIDSEVGIYEYDTPDGWHVRHHPSKGVDGYYVEMYTKRIAVVTTDLWEPWGSSYLLNPQKDMFNFTYPLVLSRKLIELPSFGTETVGVGSRVVGRNDYTTRTGQYGIQRPTAPDGDVNVIFNVLINGYTEENPADTTRRIRRV